jgi:NTE family protein
MPHGNARCRPGTMVIFRCGLYHTADMTRTDESRPRLGLALGGGAALGWAHVGVLQALDAHDIRPDLLAGTSAGAIVAALYAFGLSPDEIVPRVGELGWRRLSHFSMNSLGVLTNEGLEQAVEEAIGPARLEDAKLPVAVVTADIHTGERVVLREGPVGLAVRASACIPGIFVPVELDENTLVDGGVVENVPVQAVRELGSQVTVAVALMGLTNFRPVRTLIGVLANAFDIAMDAAQDRELEGADIVIRPDLREFRRWDTDTDTRDEIIEAGRRAGLEAAPKIAELLES